MSRPYGFLVFLCATFIVLAAARADNLFENADFADGMRHWWSSFASNARDHGLTHRIEDGKLLLDIPVPAEGSIGNVLMGQTASLKVHEKYRLSYTISIEQPGVMRHVYQLSNNPWTAQGLVENIPLQAGTHQISAIFVSEYAQPELPAHFTFNLSRLKGRVVLSDFVVSEYNELNLRELNSRWQAFIGVQAPASYTELPATLPGSEGGAVRPIATALQDEAIDLAALNQGRFKERAVAILYNGFDAEEAGGMRLGLSADWWMEVFHNGKRVYGTLQKGNGSQRFGPNDHYVDLAVTPGYNLLAIKVLSGSAGWKLVCGEPLPPIVYKANEEWQPVNLSHVVIEEGSALDFSALVPRPAGQLGRLTIREDGELVFADAPERIVRMQGFNGFPSSIWYLEDAAEFKQQVRDFARAARRQGYSLFRVHGLLDRWLCHGSTGDMAINPEKLDRWDYILAEFKKEGIYTHMVIFSFGLYDDPKNARQLFEDRNKHRLMLYFGGDWEREHFRYGVETLLNHVNPYTGLAWKDDPLIAFLEFYNEQGSGFGVIHQVLRDDPKAAALIKKRWHDWLLDHYAAGVPAELTAELAGTPLAEAPVPNFYRDKATPLGNAFGLFRSYITVDGADWCRQLVRDNGYQGLITQYNASKRLGCSAARWQISQVTDLHAYYQHPRGGWGEPGCTVEQDSSLTDAANYWRNTNSCRLSGRPFIVSEFNHSYWNPYQYEGGLVFPAYSALQGFSALEIHSGPVALDATRSSINSFACAQSPVVRANEVLSTLLFLRGDVQKASHLVELLVPEASLASNGLSHWAVSTEQSRLALLTGFSIAFPWAARAEGTSRGRTPELQILPNDAAKVDDQDWFVNVIENPDGEFSLPQAVGALRERGVLSRQNSSDVAAGVFESDTGELIMRVQDRVLKVVTPRTEAVAMESGNSEQLGRLRISELSVSATLALASTSMTPLAAAERMIFIFSTQTQNTGASFEYDGRKKLHSGLPPVLLRTGAVRAHFTPAQKRAFALYALDFNGQRRERLPLAYEGEELVIAIHNGKLEHGPTSFFELVTE
jgi:hypothetical protein